MNFYLQHRQNECSEDELRVKTILTATRNLVENKISFKLNLFYFSKAEFRRSQLNGRQLVVIYSV